MAYRQTVEIAAPLNRVWRAWSSKSQLERWLAPRANVAFREGGAWEFFWAKRSDKDSTLGCKLLKISPEKSLRFQWQGKSDFLELFLQPVGRRTEIEVRFTPRPRGVRVDLIQSETRKHPKWGAYDSWMSKAWEMALAALKADCEALDFHEVLADSRRFNGGLGVVTFAVVKALRRAGATEKEVAAALAPLKAHFPNLSAPDRLTLCRMIHARMEEERKKGWSADHGPTDL